MRFIALAFLAVSLSAQEIGRPIPVPNPLVEYLGLQPGQQRSITQNNSQYFEWRSEKERRIYQVRFEIAEETAREPLNPPALGIRYAEVESLCREIGERTKQLVRVNQAVLTPDQRLRLSALGEALKLVPVANEAIGTQLMEGQAVGPGNVIPAARISPSILGPGILPFPAVSACAPPAGGFARILLGLP